MHIRLRPLALFATLFACAAGAQTYPSRPITLIVPFATGGPSDAHMRQLAPVMAKHLGQPIVIENVPGGAGNIGPARVARAAPDGYTVLQHNLGLATAPAFHLTPGFDPAADFDYIGSMSFDPSVIMARIDFPAGPTFGELVAYLKANQAKISFGDGGGPSLLSALLFQSFIGTRITMIPYKGTGPAMNDLIARHIDMLSNSSSVVGPHIKAGKVRPVGVTSRMRIASIPDVPTLHEQGLTGFEMMVWTALFAPKGLPKPVQEKLVGALQAALEDPSLQAHFQRTGGIAATREQATPAALEALVKSEVDKWAGVLKNAGIQPQ